AVVELDALADAVGPGAEDDHLAAVGGRDLVLLLVGRVEVRRVGHELGRAGVHRLEGRGDAVPLAERADLQLGAAGEGGDGVAGSLSASRVTSVSKGTISRMFSRNHGSIIDSPWISAVVIPAR